MPKCSFCGKRANYSIAGEYRCQDHSPLRRASRITPDDVVNAHWRLTGVTRESLRTLAHEAKGGTVLVHAAHLVALLDDAAKLDVQDIVEIKHSAALEASESFALKAAALGDAVATGTLIHSCIEQSEKRVRDGLDPLFRFLCGLSGYIGDMDAKTQREYLTHVDALGKLLKGSAWVETPPKPKVDEPTLHEALSPGKVSWDQEDPSLVLGNGNEPRIGQKWYPCNDVPGFSPGVRFQITLDYREGDVFITHITLSGKRFDISQADLLQHWTLVGAE